MKSKQCKGCPNYLKEVSGCCKNRHSIKHTNPDGTTEDHYFYDKISSIPRCEDANGRKGGVDNACQ